MPQSEPPIAILSRLIMAGALIWIGSILKPVAEKVPEMIRQVQTFNETAAAIKAKIDRLPL